MDNRTISLILNEYNLSDNISNIMIINYEHINFCSSQGREKQNVKMRTKYVVEEMNSIKRI